MGERISLGRKDMFLPINPADLIHEEDHADIISDVGGTTTIIRFPQSLLLQLPDEPRCATVSGALSLGLHVNADAFVEGFELLEVDALDVFAETPAERQLAEDLPY